jgi:predicted dinucleotide-binding enzyme
VSGDDAAAKATVLQLVDDLGFEPVDVGGLDESWRHQPGSRVYGTDYDAAGVRDALAAAPKARTPQWSGTAHSPGTFAHPA